MSLAEARFSDLLDKWFMPKDKSELPDAPEDVPDWAKIIPKLPEADGAWFRRSDEGTSYERPHFTWEENAFTVPYVHIGSGGTAGLNTIGFYGSVPSTVAWTTASSASFGNTAQTINAGGITYQEVPGDFENGNGTES